MSDFTPNSDNIFPERVSSTSNVMPSLNPPAIASGKRPRRMRSTQGAAHYGNGQKGKKGPGATNNSNNKATPKAEYHDRKNSAPIFLQKTYEMINSCDPILAGWTADGTMFVIKDQDVFAKEIIPKFFDHNKFTSFARQLNFYGFRKMQSRAIYKDDSPKENAKHVTFFNEKFQRGKKHLLKEIQRSTKGGSNSQNQQEMQKEINALKNHIGQLNNTISRMQHEYSNRFAALETQMQNFFSYSNAQQPTSFAGTVNQQHVQFSDTTTTYASEATANIEPIDIHKDMQVQNNTDNNNEQQATLPPHPNSKNLPTNGQMPPPPPLNGPQRGVSRLDSNFLRGLSNASLMGDIMPDMAPFEKKLFQNAMSGPDPVSSNPLPADPNSINIEPTPLNVKPARSLTREISQSLGELALDPDEFPPLTNV